MRADDVRSLHLKMRDGRAQGNFHWQHKASRPAVGEEVRKPSPTIRRERRFGIKEHRKSKTTKRRAALMTNEDQLGQIVVNSSVLFDGRCYGGGLYERRVQCKLKQMKDIGAINSVTSFFEDIVRYAEHADGEDPTWGFSDAQGARLAGSALRRFIFFSQKPGKGC
jgi:hypothetical protein